jgi:spermidine/putrescine-binding protein
MKTKRSFIKRLAVALTFGTALAVSGASLVQAADGDLTVFDWAGYEDPAFHPDYVEKNGDSPSFAFFADEDEAFAKLMSGFKADVAHPCSQSVVKWRDAGLLEPLDTSRIKGWDGVSQAFKDMKGLVNADGKSWLLPFDWGNTSLTYRTDKVDEKDVESLQAFADPKFKGRVSIGDNVDDAYALAALAIGMKDWTAMNDDQFKQASDFLRKVHKNVRLYWTDGTELAQAMGGGEVDLAWAWNETATRLSAENVPVKMKKDTKEGDSTWVCGYVRLKGAPGSEEKAYDFLSAVNQPKVAEYLVTEWGYGHGNGAAMKQIPADTLAASGYGDIESFVDKTLFQSPVPAELKQKMIDEFEKIKAGY